jgi:hypothetical protein
MIAILAAEAEAIADRGRAAGDLRDHLNELSGQRESRMLIHANNSAVRDN